MNPAVCTRWAEIDPLLDDLLDRPVDQRAEWLQAHCADPELHALVLALLASDTIHGERIEAQAAAAHARLEAQAACLPEIPGYRVLQLIGEGGMASVFLAERVLGETVQRVALKRLRLNVYDPDERRRFGREHRILARLEHPNIARLLDAGIAPDGVPWFAMEYVDGEPLIAWCDAHRLDPESRLALYVDVCAAVQHAHQHLVVHRDLKPSNMLVDASGRVKLLDFGIARLLEPDTTDGDGTRTEHRRLTPGYAAPEQYAGLVSTATDIYALGVILVELLCGQRPVATRAANSDPLDGLAVTGIDAEARAATRSALERLLAGDLGAIARKAMRSEPALRYGSAHALREDLIALRDARPVAARRGDWRYRAGCFIRRHRVGVATAGLVVATLLGATGISLDQARRANEQAARAQAVQAFVENMLAPLRVGVPQSRMPTLDEVLADGVRDLDRRHGRDPAVYSDLMLMFARTYERMGDIKAAHTLAERAYAYNANHFGGDDPRTIQALAMRGGIHMHLAEFGQGRRVLEAALERMRSQGIEGAPLADVLDDLSTLELQDNRFERAVILRSEAYRQRLQHLGLDHPDIALSYAGLGFVEMGRGHPAVAVEWMERAWRHSVAHFGRDTLQSAVYLGEVAGLRSDSGLWRDGARDYAAALAIFDRLDRRDHPARMNILRGGCQDWTRLDELERAGRDCDAAIAMAGRLRGIDSWLHTVARRDRIPLLVARGELRAADAEARAILRNLHGLRDVPDNSLWFAQVLHSGVQQAAGDHVRSRDGLLKVVRGIRTGDCRAPVESLFLARLALACAHAPHPACPRDLVAHADAKLACASYLDHPRRVEVQMPLARLALKQGDIAQAHARLDDIQRVAALPHVRLPPSHRWRAEARMLRGEALEAQGDRLGALREWRAAEAVFAARYPADHPLRRALATRLRDSGS